MQEFNKGDHVKIVKNQGSTRSHFPSDKEAIIIGPYRDQFGGEDTDIRKVSDHYTIFVKGDGEHSWYYNQHLVLIERNRLDLLKEWEEEIEKENMLKTDLNWIFSHGEEVLEKAHGSTVSSLTKCFGFTNLCGSRGEGITYYENARKVLLMAAPYLQNNDKYGWFKKCVEIQVSMEGK